MTVDTLGTDSNLDTIFAEIGEFSVFQIITYFLICIPNSISATYVVSYMFTANTLDYRCKIRECDVVPSSDNRIEYNQPWLHLAIPFINNSLDNCLRYAPVSANSSVAISPIENGQCDSSFFDATRTTKCTEYVYKTDEINIQTEFNIHCEDTYKLALVGTVNNVGRFIFMPLTGLLSDKFGRLTVLVVGMVCSSLFGIIKSFSISYIMFVLCEFLESSAGTCTFAAAYILGIEWVSTKNRVLGSTIISISYPIGEICLGVAAMYIHNFRYLIRTLYTPGLLIVAYFWLVPESIRWLLVTGRIERAERILKRVARINGKEMSQKSIESIQLRYMSSSMQSENINDTLMNGGEKIEKTQSITQSLGSALKSKTLCFRFINGCYCWMTCAYCYYGLSLISTQIRGDQNKYLSFITVVAAEIPGLLIALLLLNRIGRRTLLCLTLIVTGLSTMTTSLVPENRTVIVLVLFMIGKCSITCAFSVLYIFTAELWPTNLRNTMMNLCSMIGRSGAMLAPLTPLLAYHFVSLPYLLFGGTAILAGLLVLLCPETLGKKLPDTIEEAKNLR